MRGAHDGFIETLVANAALLRRRIRDPQLTLEGHTVSDCSRADVVLCYLENKVDRKLLDEVRQKLAKIDVRSVSMSQESIAEAMMGKKQWWTPFPKVRYTERPDAATACVMEGDIVVLVDNSPAAMILPTHFFDFVQEANDFYFPPLIGTYLRILRIVVFLLTMFITPVWFLLVKDPSRTQAGLEFLAIDSDYSVPLLVQLLLAEFIVDLLKLASLNTPDVFSNSFSMLGALVLGDFAVQAHWLVPEVLAYMAFVAIANFAQPSYELGYAFKLLRVALLRAAAMDCGVTDITQKGRQLVFSFDDRVDPAALLAVCTMAAYRSRAQLSAGAAPRLTLYMQPGEEPLAAAGALVDALRLHQTDTQQMNGAQSPEEAKHEE